MSGETWKKRYDQARADGHSMSESIRRANADGWERGRWFRVYMADGERIWCETSDKEEAVRAAADPESDGVVWKQWRREETEWRVEELP